MVLNAFVTKAFKNDKGPQNLGIDLLPENQNKQKISFNYSVNTVRHENTLQSVILEIQKTLEKG